MTRAALFSVLLVTVVWSLLAQSPRVSRAALQAMEVSFDKRITTISVDSPFRLLGNTRGVYLAGYGAVFTAELNLMVTTNVTPFQLTIPKEYVVKVHTQKLQQVALLKRSMQDALLDTAASLDGVPATEQMALGVSLLYYSWEDKTSLPSQIVMRAQRQKLLDIHMGRVNRTTLGSIIQVEEL